jgi:hypothetical protein
MDGRPDKYAKLMRVSISIPKLMGVSISIPKLMGVSISAAAKSTGEWMGVPISIRNCWVSRKVPPEIDGCPETTAELMAVPKPLN